MKKKLLATLLSLAMVLSLLPTWAIAEGEDEAKITGNGDNAGQYATLAEAVAAAQDGDTVELLADVTVTEAVTIPAGKTLTLDFAGKTVTANVVVDEDNGPIPGIVTNLGTLTLKDSSGNGGINGGSNMAYAVLNQATLTVEGGTYVGGAYAHSFGFTIWNPAIENNTEINENPTVLIKGGNFRNQGNEPAVSGYDGITVRGGVFSSDPTSFVDTDNYIVTENNGTWTVLPEGTVAVVGTTGYDTLQAAFNAAVAGDTVKVLAASEKTIDLTALSKTKGLMYFFNPEYKEGKEADAKTNAAASGVVFVKDTTNEFADTYSYECELRTWPQNGFGGTKTIFYGNLETLADVYATNAINGLIRNDLKDSSIQYAGFFPNNKALSQNILTLERDITLKHQDGSNASRIDFRLIETPFTFDLNGHTIYQESNVQSGGIVDPSDGSAALRLSYFNDVTIIDNVGDGWVSGSLAAVDYYGVYDDTETGCGKLTLESGTLIGRMVPAWTKDKTKGIYDYFNDNGGKEAGCVIMMDDTNCTFIMNGGTLDIDRQAYKHGALNETGLWLTTAAIQVGDGCKNATITLNGGSIERMPVDQQAPTNQAGAGKYADINPELIYIDDTDSSVTVTAGNITTYPGNVAKIGDTEYATLAAALKAAESGATIEILDGTWGLESIGTLDQPGKYDNANLVRYKSLTIQPAEGAKPVFTSNVNIGYEDSSTTNATILVKGLNFQNASLALSNYVQATVEDCHFSGSGSTAGELQILNSCCTNHKTEGEYPQSLVTVKDCVIDGTNGTGEPGIRLRNVGDVVVTGNKISNTNHNAILFETNKAMDNSQSKTISVTGNTITEWNVNNASGGGRGIRASFQYTGYDPLADGSTVTITDNYFTKGTLGLDTPDFIKITGAGSAAVDLSDNYWNNMTLEQVTGTDRSKYYTCDSDGTPTITSVKNAYVAKIDETEYTTLAAAIAAVPAGTKTTITMIDNEAIDVAGHGVEIVAGKNIVLDLNGYTVAGVCSTGKGSELILNKGILTVKDSSDENANGSGNGKMTYGATPTWDYNGTISGSYASSLINNRGTLTIESGYYLNDATGSACYVVDNYSNGQNVSFTLTGGLLKNEHYCPLRFATDATHTNNAVLSGGKIEGLYCVSINCNNAKASVYDISFEGTVVDGKSIAIYESSGSTAQLTDTSKSHLSIKNGMFGGGKNNDGEKIFEVTASAKKFITGGYFESMVEAGDLADGYECVASGVDAYPYKVQAVKAPEVETPAVVEVDTTDTTTVKVDDQPITVTAKTESGGEQPVDETIAAATATAIETLLSNEEIKKVDTKIADAIDTTTKPSGQTGGFNLSYILDALKTEAASTEGLEVQAATGTAQETFTVNTTEVKDADVTKTIKIDLKAAEVVTAAEAATTTVSLSGTTYDVKPIATITVEKEDGEKETVTAVIPNDAITSPITFRLPVPDTYGTYAKVVHHETSDADSDVIGTYTCEVKGEEGARYVEVSTKHFCLFETSSVDEEVPFIAQVTVNGTTQKFEYNMDVAGCGINAAIEYALNNDAELEILWDFVTITGVPEGKTLKVIANKHGVEKDPDCLGRVVITDASYADHSIVFSVATDNTSYNVNDPVTVTLSATDNGSPLSSYYGAQAFVTYDPTYLTPPTSLPANWFVKDDHTLEFYEIHVDAQDEFAAKTTSSGVISTLTFTARTATGDAGTLIGVTDPSVTLGDEELIMSNADVLIACTAAEAAQLVTITLGTRTWAENNDPDAQDAYSDPTPTYTGNPIPYVTKQFKTMDEEIAEVAYYTKFGDSYTPCADGVPTDAGEYYVKFFVAEDDAYARLENVNYLPYTILPKELYIDTTGAIGTPVYSGKAIQLLEGDVTAKTAADGATVNLTDIKYSLDDGSTWKTWSAITSKKAIGTVCNIRVKATSEDSNYKVADNASFNVTILSPIYQIVKRSDFVAGGTLVLVFTDEDAVYKCGSDFMYDVTGLGYGTTGDKPTTRGVESIGELGSDQEWNHVYARLVSNDSAASVEVSVSTTRAVAGQIPVNATNANDVKYDKKVNIDDAVAVMLSYNKGMTYYSPTELTNYMANILRSDVDRNGKADSVDAGYIEAVLHPIH